MNINLIIPPSPWLISDTDIPFLGVLYLSAYLKNHGIGVEVTDLAGVDLATWTPNKFDTYGITGTSAHFPQIRDISYRISQYFPNAPIIAGGPHATLAPFHLLKHSTVDICVQGPGEERLLNLLKTGESDGVIRWDSETPGALSITPRSVLSENYNMAVLPDYEAINFKKYLPSQTYKYLLGIVNEATVFTTLGCPFRCNFCAQHKMRDRTRHIPLTEIDRNISYLKKKYKVKLLYISDDTFGFEKSRFGDLIRLLKKQKIAWHCLLRADLAQQPRLEAMKDAGCIGIVYGFETGSDKILKLMNKRVTVKQNYQAAELTHELGMKVRGQMVVGFPGETDKTIFDTRIFIANAPVDHWGIHTFQPFPGSDVWENPEKYKIKIDKNTDFSDWHTIGKSTEKVGSLKVQKWVDHLRDIAGERSIEKVVE
jgi:anaerobic magnesium-protoporphyrin IX monomethyl ester cyclase